MICQHCNSREATKNTYIDYAGTKMNVYVCDECYKRINDKNVIADAFKSSFFEPEEIEIRCEKCKTTLSDFEETLYLGCENCYKVFANEIARKALEINGKNVYVGKIPPKLVSKIARANELNQLKSKYRDLVNAGKVHEANKVRERIFTIEGGVL